ncbi:MAG: RNA methyltransferase [Patescibacteria group bacterium]
MLSKNQEKVIKSLQTKKGRQKHGLCLVEGSKVIETAGDLVDYTFGPDDVEKFDDLVTTETPQEIAAVARIPEWNLDQIKSHKTIVLLDGVQDPGNVGAILRLCLGLNASLLLIESADVTNPKVIRSSAGAMFQVPWLQIKRSEAKNLIKDLNREIYRLEKSNNAVKLDQDTIKSPALIIAGSEGQGIKLDVGGTSIFIEHDDKLESLNVGHAIAIALYSI